MPRTQTVSAPTYRLHEEGVFYNGYVKNIEDAFGGQFGDQYKLILVFDEDQEVFDEGQKPGEEERETWHYVPVNYTTHEKNRLRIFWDGVHGLSEPLPIDTPLDVDDLIGKRFRAIFKHGKKKDGTPKDEIIIVKPAAPQQVSGQQAAL